MAGMPPCNAKQAMGQLSRCLGSMPGVQLPPAGAGTDRMSSAGKPQNPSCSPPEPTCKPEQSSCKCCNGTA